MRSTPSIIFRTQVHRFRLNQYGGSVGFPILKDKFFGFVSFQAFHLKDQFPAQISLPTPAQIADATECVTQAPITILQGQCRQLLILRIHPRRLAFPGHSVSIMDLDQVAIKFLGLRTMEQSIPLVPRCCRLFPPVPRGVTNVTANNSLDLTNFHVKVDYIFNPSHRMSVKYLFGDSFQSQPATAGVPHSVGPNATGTDMWNSVAPT